MWKNIWNFVTGNAASVVQKVETAVDDYFYTDEEKANDKLGSEEVKNKFKERMAEIKKELTESQSNFKIELEKLITERENQIHDTYRTEIKASKEIIIAELSQSDLYTKRARPTIIYTGLAIILLEILGLRLFIFDKLLSSNTNYADIIKSSTAVLKSFLYMWGGVAGAYAIGRTAEKRGISNTLTQMATGNKKLEPNKFATNIEDRVKELVKW